MAEQGSSETAVFDFLVVRAPGEIGSGRERRNTIRDRRLGVALAPTGPEPSWLGDLAAVSPVTADVLAEVAAWNGRDITAAYDRLLARLLARMSVRRAPGAPPDGMGTPVVTIEELESGASLRSEDRVYLLPDRLWRLEPAYLIAPLTRAMAVLDHLPPSVDELVRLLSAALGADLVQYVFGPADADKGWDRAQAAVFDAFYVCYVSGRWARVNLDPLMEALRALHKIEIIAADHLVTRLMNRPQISADDQALLDRTAAVWPGLEPWARGREGPPPGFPLLTDVALLSDVADLGGTPVTVHPLFPRLFRYLRAGDRIEPIGVGDLKVVRQRLTAYRAGEISHIHNIMRGEIRGRTHRRLEKSEEVFSSTGSRSQETTQDNQSTDRFELKSETDAVVRDSLNVNANASSSLTYNGSPAKVTVSAGSGFAYTRSHDDHSKFAQNFARDVVTKATERIETRTTSTRTSTLTFETEERNRQQFDNVGGEEHISGIYRWVDKEYTAQLYNYGRRVMYEFLVPEPAALWIASRLRGFEAELDVPQPPVPPVSEVLDLGFTPADIDAAKYRELSHHYDLTAQPIPAETMTVALVAADTRSAVFTEKGVTLVDNWYTVGKDCKAAGAIGYDVTAVSVQGHLDYNFENSDPPNLFGIQINGTDLTTTTSNHEYWFLPDDFGGTLPAPPSGRLPLTSEDVTVAFSFHYIGNYSFLASLHLALGDGRRDAWRGAVFETVRRIEQERVDQRNAELQRGYQEDLAQYRNRLAQLAGTRVALLTQGASEAANRAVMDEEIKRACLTLITREFDTEDGDDVLPGRPALGERTVQAGVTRFTVDDKLAGNDRTTAGFVRTPTPTKYPAIDIANARANGLLVQFLEQAFEWERMSYIFYPYFWAQQEHWIELMNRADDADPAFTAFLRTGMCRVLLAVSEKYECAVQHYLDSGVPWNGGCAPPTIDTRLFVPLNEELREQQLDDREGGVPEGEPWVFTLPTSLVYLHGSATPLPDIQAERASQTGP